MAANASCRHQKQKFHSTQIAASLCKTFIIFLSILTSNFCIQEVLHFCNAEEDTNVVKQQPHLRFDTERSHSNGDGELKVVAGGSERLHTPISKFYRSQLQSMLQKPEK